MFMQSNVGAYEVRRDSQTNEVSIVPISQEEYSTRTRNQYSSQEYEDYFNHLISSLTDDIHTFHAIQRVIIGLNQNSIRETSIAKPKVSLEDFEKLEKCVEVTSCGICFEDMKDNIKLNCYHVYCNRCIKKWLTEKSNTCPTCRTQIVF